MGRLGRAHRRGVAVRIEVPLTLSLRHGWLLVALVVARAFLAR